MHNYHVIMLSETNLSEDVTDSELGMHNYNIFRRDRSMETSQKKSMGGVLIAVHKSTPSKVFPTEAPVEQIYVSAGSVNKPYILGCIYLSTISPLADYLLVSETVDLITRTLPHAELFITGDFNLPKASWVQEDLYSVAIPRGDTYVPPQTQDCITAVSDICTFHNLYQLNGICNVNNAVLDLVLGSVKCNVLSCPPLVRVDAHHPPLCFNIQSSKHFNTSRQAEEFYYDYRSADYTVINDYLGSFCWDDIVSDLDIVDMLNKFYVTKYIIPTE